MSNLIVNTKYGPVQGRQRVSHKNVNYLSFQGIPYAKPPIGEFRFKDPQPPEKWTDVFDATQPGPIAPSAKDILFTTIEPNASEECLRLNVYTKELNPSPKRPVMIYIHGGGFVTGSSSEAFYSPELLLQKDIVFVSINYRLSVFGFLSISDPKYNIPGNAGLKDQSLALRWVRENCEHFGGDPENITLFGESAGAASVHYQLISERSRNLFHRAIIQSASALNPWAHRSNTDELTKRLAKRLGWNGEGGIDKIVELLQSAKMEDIVKYQYEITEEERQHGQLFGFVPCIEPYDNDGSAFLPKSIPEMMKNSWGNQIPILIGGTSEEGCLYYMQYKVNERIFDDDGYFLNAIPWELGETISKNDRKLLGNKLKNYYFQGNEPTRQTVNNLVPLLGDGLFWHGIYVIIRSRLQNPNSAPTYFYRFSFDSQLMTFFKTFLAGEIVKGCIHGEDIMYLFKMENINDNLPKDSVEEKICQIFINSWTSFALNGNPNCVELKTIDWQPLEKGDTPLKCVNIDETVEIIELPETERMELWHSIYNYGI